MIDAAPPPSAAPTALHRPTHSKQQEPSPEPAAPPAPSLRRQRRMAMAWLRKARDAATCHLWWQHGHYLAAARRSLLSVPPGAARTRMTRAANGIAAMDAWTVSHA